MDREDRTALWFPLLAHLRALAAMFGLPNAIARGPALSARERRRLRAWLAALEALTRRILLLLASALPAPSPARGGRHDFTGPPTHGRAGAASEDSADWSVGFRLSPPPPRVAPKRDTARAFTPHPFPHDAFALAERFEALIRVALDPDPYARRMARALAAKPQRARRLACGPAHRARRPCALEFRLVQPLAYAAAQRWDSS